MALVDGRPSIADIVKVGVTGKKAVKLGDHSVPLPARAELEHSEFASIGQRVGGISCLAARQRARGPARFHNRIPASICPSRPDSASGHRNALMRCSKQQLATLSIAKRPSAGDMSLATAQPPMPTITSDAGALLLCAADRRTSGTVQRGVLRLAAQFLARKRAEHVGIIVRPWGYAIGPDPDPTRPVRQLAEIGRITRNDEHQSV